MDLLLQGGEVRPAGEREAGAAGGDLAEVSCDRRGGEDLQHPLVDLDLGEVVEERRAEPLVLGDRVVRSSRLASLAASLAALISTSDSGSGRSPSPSSSGAPSTMPCEVRGVLARFARLRTLILQGRLDAVGGELAGDVGADDDRLGLVGGAMSGVQRERLVEQLAIEAHAELLRLAGQELAQLGQVRARLLLELELRDRVAGAGDEHVIGQVFELLVVFPDEDRDRVCNQVLPARRLVPLVNGSVEHAPGCDRGQIGVDLRERGERLDGHHRHDAFGDLRTQLLGQVENQQPLTDPRERDLERLADALAGIAVLADQRLVAERLLEQVERDAEPVGEHRVEQVRAGRLGLCLDERGRHLDLGELGGAPAPLAVDQLVVAVTVGGLNEQRVIEPAGLDRVREPFELLLVEVLARVVLRNDDVIDRDLTQRVGTLRALLVVGVDLGVAGHLVLHRGSRAQPRWRALCDPSARR